MRRDLWFKLVFCCAAPLFLIGCTRDTPSGATGGGGKPSAGGTNAGGDSGSPGDFKIVILTNGSSPFWDACDRGLKDAGNELGVRVALVRTDATEGGQIRRLEQLATQNDVKGIGVSVLESQASGVVEQMQALRAKGIKVITVDSDGPREGREAFVGTNNIEAGRELGQLASQLNPKGGKAVA